MRIAETADFSPAAKILWGAEGSDLVCHAWHHPRYHAHALREHDRTLGCGFPQRVREVPGRQRQNAGQRLLIAFIFAPRLVLVPGPDHGLFFAPVTARIDPIHIEQVAYSQKLFFLASIDNRNQDNNGGLVPSIATGGRPCGLRLHHALHGGIKNTRSALRGAPGLLYFKVSRSQRRPRGPGCRRSGGGSLSRAR